MGMAKIKEALAERYELLDVLGRGGMGVVYRAHDRLLSRTVAVKVLTPDAADDPSLVARFEREALAAAALNHPNIVAVYDTGLDGDTHYLVMECVPGVSLAESLRERGRLSPRAAVRIAAQIASALAAAHRAGIVHRDVKPANVMVDEAGNVRVLDFGIARVAARSSLTRTATILGSPPYLAPEIAQGQPADGRSDLYSLGCVLYEMLTGRPPFTGEAPAAVIHQHNTARPQAPSESNSAVPAALDALVMEMLAKEPRDRPQRAEQLEHALPASLEGDTAVFARTGRPPPVMPRGLRVRRSGVIALLAALLIVAAGLALSLQGSPRAAHRRGAAITHGKRPAHSPTHTHQRAQSPARTTTTAPATSSTSAQPAPTPPPAQPTVQAAVGALTALLARDLQSGRIDPHAAQQIEAHLQYADGGGEALQRVAELGKSIQRLAAHGEISAAALPAIVGAAGNILAALERSGQSAQGSSGASD